MAKKYRKSSSRRSGQEMRSEQFFGRRRKLSPSPLDTSIAVPAKDVRPTLRKGNTCHALLGRTSRAVSPNTIKRMQRALGITTSITSAPTILDHDKEESSARSVPPFPLHGRQINEIVLPIKVDEKIAKRHSMNLLYLGSKRNDRLPENVKTQKSIGLSTSQSLSTRELVSKRKSSEIKVNVKVPKGKITIVITDIQGSSRMWEENASAMKDALDIHDSIIRKCYVKQSGYEITTEGDSFHLAFHHPLDAFSFCCDCQQKLFDANWSEEILALKNAEFDAARALRGMRVRMGVHQGLTTTKVHAVTRRIYYNGEGLQLAKAMEKASHGGQIITNVETWRALSGMGERYLGSPQILDLGVHELEEMDEAVYTKSLLQLVPRELAFDYCSFRGTKTGKNNEHPEGRTFPPPKTKRQICPAFFDAPYLDNMVTIVFVNTIISEQNSDEKKTSEILRKLSKMIRNLLIRTNPHGYECQEDNGSWMLAFHSLESAIVFGLNLIEKVSSMKMLSVKVGIHRGEFTSMGPHVVTGRADYFGAVVNRAARIAAHCKTKELRLGIPKRELQDFEAPNIKQVKVSYVGTEMFKGINVEIALFACVPSLPAPDKKDGKMSFRRLSLNREKSEKSL